MSEAFFLVITYKNLKKKVDFIIIGQGIAGTVLAYQLLKQNKKIIIIDQFNKNSSSRVALGVYNPLVLKWFTKSWEAENQIKELFSFCQDFEATFNVKINHKKNIYKFLESNYAINNWNEKQSSPNRKHFMSEDLKYLKNIKNPFGLVLNSGWVDISQMLSTFRDFLIKKNMCINEEFMSKKLILEKKLIKYENIESEYIVFCEGASVLKNPYFKNLGLKVTKGEVIEFFSADLDLNQIIHSGVITIPMDKHVYYAGSTFDWKDLNFEKTKKAANEIIKKIQKLKNFNYKIIKQKASIRPSTKDRRPIIGSHKNYNNIYIMNGLGSRGVLLSPYLVNQLCLNIFEGKSIDPEIDVNRFDYTY